MIFLKKINIHVIKKQRGNGGVSNKHQVKSWPRLVHAQGARSWKWNVNISPASPTHFFIIQFRNTCLKETNSHFIYTYPCVFSSWLQRNALFCPSVVSWQDFFWGLSLSLSHTHKPLGRKKRENAKLVISSLSWVQVDQVCTRPAPSGLVRPAVLGGASARPLDILSLSVQRSVFILPLPLPHPSQKPFLPLRIGLDKISVTFFLQNKRHIFHFHQ